MPLKLSTQKPGDTVQKLSLNLNKGSTFSVELYWDSDQDLDAHALLANNDSGSAKVTAMEQVLSTYNTKKMNSGGVLTNASDGSFSTPCGTLTHSGDSRSGVQKDVDEIITIDGSKAPSGMNEIPIFVTIHNTGVTFARINKAGIRIKDNAGKELCSYELSNEFGAFNAVQMGSLILGQKGWEFAAVGTGFHGDFNKVLEHFS